MIFKKGVLENFAIFTGKHSYWSLFLIKLQAWRPATLLKKRLQYRCFPVNIPKFLRTAFFIEHLQWLLLLLYLLYSVAMLSVASVVIWFYLFDPVLRTPFATIPNPPKIILTPILTSTPRKNSKKKVMKMKNVDSRYSDFISFNPWRVPSTTRE